MRRSSVQGKPAFVDIRDAQGRLLCRYDSERHLIEIKRRHEEPIVIDLKVYMQAMRFVKEQQSQN